MTDQMKQRVVGIGVLVFLAIIILPWLFGSNQSVVFEEKKKLEKEKMIAADLPELIKQPPQDIKPVADQELFSANKLQKHAKASQPTYDNWSDKGEINNPHPAGKTYSRPNAVDRGELASVNASDRSKVEQKLNATKLNYIEDTIVHAQSDARPPVSRSMALEPAAPDSKKPLANTSRVSKTAPKKSMTKPIEKDWLIQLGSFSNKANAEKLVKELKNKGYAAYLKTSKVKDQSITRVFVKPGALKITAQATLEKIEQTFKLHGVITKTKL